MAHRPLPIQQFPDMALMKIFGLMKPLDVVFMTQTSSKMKTIIRKNSRTRPISMMLISDAKGSYVSIMWGESVNTYIELIVSRTPCGYVDHKDGLKFHPKLFGCITYCTGLYSGYCAIIDFLNELYFIDSFSIDCHWKTQKEMKSIVQYAKTVGLKLDYVRLIGSLTCKSENKEMLNECKEAGTVYLQASEICDFNDLQVDRLTLEHPKNFGVNHLLTTLRCKSVILLDAYLPPDELNEFLHVWKNGNDTFGYFELDRDYDLRSVIGGLEATSVESAVLDGKRVQKFLPYKCYRFNKADGTRALVYCLHFKFIVRIEK
ncbi:hypothetical protein GCK72_022373 [Caenorhabditis remanei]|uniref:F-box domain-containing protein n=1 Tax=Caenorhabditis remanei TaxID=31234 RepID=A0A6A5FTV6_CAERE|nr:hypothetical protein GCK72_022373 [Caenorhabditis remanei]KAF1745926.1 hypothetical protein GCK72_022373 [Caenorhabditis remanei]